MIARIGQPDPAQSQFAIWAGVVKSNLLTNKNIIRIYYKKNCSFTFTINIVTIEDSELVHLHFTWYF